MAEEKRPERGSDSGFEKRVDDFADEMEKIGKRVEEKMEATGKRIENRLQDFEERKEHRERHYRHMRTGIFGIFGPLFSAIFGLVILVVLIWLLGIASQASGIHYLNAVAGFLLDNLGLLFLAGLFFGYAEYAMRRYPEPLRFFRPLVIVAGIIFALWIAFSIVVLLPFNFSFNRFFSITPFLTVGIILLFALLALIGLAGLAVSKASEKPVQPNPSEQSSPNPGGIKRLYRSGKERLLGGVCGGIAEYTDTDPVVVRLLWIVASLVFGIGVLVYIISWIIVPRNPAHNWS